MTNHASAIDEIPHIDRRNAALVVCFVGLFTLAMGTVANCSPPESERMSNTSSAHITRQQAVITAERHLRQTGAAGKCLLLWPRVKQSEFSDDAWRVIFWPNPLVVWRIPYTYSVEIDMGSGEVTSSGWDK